ncbi:hypothetical protein SIID45300_02114 [Candidatus Magnetaquicoccaceae bacterium FCR-1]|uniref:MaoC-like domain-containing protein n=1 Tax=Candidatus Magnetaquiglobus chichijimensis TaxID=3141448 RepID=A0ABQ0CA66_9PROT
MSTHTINAYQWQDLRIGLEHAFQATITETMMERFLAISGDCNPLHVDATFAVRQGFRDRVVYGLLTASFYSTLAGVYLPGRFALLHGIDIAFSKPVFIGDTLTISGRIVYLNEACKQLQVGATIVNDAEVVVSKAKIKVGLVDDKEPA